jgi:hypothetical protein
MAEPKKKNSSTEDEDIDLIDKKEEYLIDQIPKTYTLINNYWSLIEKNLPRNTNTLIRHIAMYRNKYIEILETPYPSDYPPWIPANIRILYEVTGIKEGDFVRDCKMIRGHEGYIDPYLDTKAFYILLNMIARYYMLPNEQKSLAILMYYIGYSYYWSVYTRYFKKYKPTLEILKYTINELSYKNALKAAGSVDKWLYTGVTTSFESYKERIMRGSDWELLYISDKIRRKFDGYFKKLYITQLKNEKEKNYIFSSKDIVDDQIVENTSGVAEVISIADKYSTKFFADPISETAIASARANGGITERDLRNTIIMIADNKENHSDVIKFFQSLFILFLGNPKYRPVDIGTLKFYAEMQKLYTPGNSSDPNKLFIKDVLDKWLKIGSSTYRVSNRAGTLNKFRKCIYDYFIQKIMIDH